MEGKEEAGGAAGVYEAHRLPQDRGRRVEVARLSKGECLTDQDLRPQGAGRIAGKRLVEEPERQGEVSLGPRERCPEGQDLRLVAEHVPHALGGRVPLGGHEKRLVGVWELAQDPPGVSEMRPCVAAQQGKPLGFRRLPFLEDG